MYYMHVIYEICPCPTNPNKGPAQKNRTDLVLHKVERYLLAFQRFFGTGLDLGMIQLCIFSPLSSSMITTLLQISSCQRQNFRFALNQIGNVRFLCQMWCFSSIKNCLLYCDCLDPDINITNQWVKHGKTMPQTIHRLSPSHHHFQRCYVKTIPSHEFSH